MANLPYDCGTIPNTMVVTMSQNSTINSPVEQVRIDTAPSQCAWLPWARWNLCRNPFGELSKQERAEVAVVDTESIASRARKPHHAVQLIGDCGRGKTTRMLALMRVLPEASYAYLPEDGPCPAIAIGDPILIDEAQRLSRSVRNSIFSTGLPLVLATHRNLERSLRRHGYTVVTEQIGNGNTPELVQELLNRRIEASRLQAGPVPSVSLEVAQRMVARFKSDVRAIESHLYEQVQSQVVHDGEMRFID